MKKIILSFLIFLQITSLFSQTELFVTAKNGLNIRAYSDLNAEKKGKFNYAEKVKVLKIIDEYFEVSDNGKKIKGQWYEVTGKSNSNGIVTGYVFSGFLTKPKQKDTFKFLNYNDDYDYYILNAFKGKSLYQFINDRNDDRSYLKGDIIEIEWKEDLIYIAGDGDTKELGDWITNTKKIKNGNVSNFRENYKHKIKYHMLNETSYSQEYLNKIYLLVEYYVSNSENELIRGLIKENSIIEYSVEKRIRGGIEYTVIGIASSFENKTNTIQWLFHNNTEPGELYLYDKLYEYNLSTDKLVEFKK